jgi:hypothetical protein
MVVTAMTSGNSYSGEEPEGSIHFSVCSNPQVMMIVM